MTFRPFTFIFRDQTVGLSLDGHDKLCGYQKSVSVVYLVNTPPSHTLCIVIYSDSQAAIRADPRPKSVIVCQTEEIISERRSSSILGRASCQNIE